MEKNGTQYVCNIKRSSPRRDISFHFISLVLRVFGSFAITLAISLNVFPFYRRTTELHYYNSIPANDSKAYYVLLEKVEHALRGKLGN